MFAKLLDFLSAPFRKVLTLPLTIVTAPRRMWGLSIAVRVAIAAFLVCVVMSVAIYFIWGADRFSARDWKPFALFLLDLAVPLSLYVAVRQWLEVVESEFPDVDRAWNAGLAALAGHNLSLEDIPLYLVLGPHQTKEVESLMTASGLEFTIKCLPEGPAPLYWFAGPDAAFVVCTNSSRLSRLASLAKTAAIAMRGGPMPSPAMATMAPAAPAFGASMMVGPAQNLSEFGQGANRGDDTDGGSFGGGWGHQSPGGGGPAPPNYGATIQPRQFDVRSVGPGPAAMPPAAAPPVKLKSADAEEATAQLAYLCRLIVKVRQPFCPINGILTVVPFSLFGRSDADAVELQTTIREDLDCIHSTIRLRCPVVALTGGMQKEEGFLELMRRVGRDAAKQQRFGRGFNPLNYPLPEQLEAVAKNACGAFEDWTYALFREKGGYDKIGNPKLYELLCKIRSQVAQRFSNVLANGFGRDPDPEKPLPLMFGGCYFAATGDKDDQQAFVKSVFDKMLEQQDLVEWTQPALRENGWYQNLANFCYCISGLLLLVIAAILVIHFQNK